MSCPSRQCTPPALLLLFLAALTGCGVDTRSQAPPEFVALTGRVHGGNQPVSGSSIQLYAASTSGYAATSTPLLTRPVLTDAGGNFSITGDYTCPAATSQVYITATGGNPGLAAGTNNSALALMAALGNCGDLSSNTFISLNELTTVAAVWPLAQFMSAANSIGTSATNQPGLRNAFLSSAKLVNTSTGNPVPSDPATAAPIQTIVPGTVINTLANVLATCVNSDGSTAADTPCGALFAATTPPGGLAPTDTISAALNVALHPTQQVTTLYNLTSATAPFQPALTTAPNNWLLGLVYVHNEIYGYVTAMDGLGNFWDVGYYSNEGSFVVGMGQTAQVFHNRGLVVPTAVAIDQHQNLWVTQSYFNAINGVFEFSPTGSTMPCGNSCGPFTGGGLTNPVALAIDAHGNIWVLNDNGALSELSPTGTPISPASGYQGLGIADTSTPYVYSGVYGMAFDPSGSLWVTSEPTNSVVKVTPASTAGAAPSSLTFAGGGISAPNKLIVDHSGAVWVANGNGTLTKLNSDGSVAISAFPVGNQCNLIWMTIDGAGTVWAAGCEIASDGTLSAGSDSVSEGLGSAPAIDASGNIWGQNGGFFNTGYTQYLGAAVPTGSSIANALTNGTLATRP